MQNTHGGVVVLGTGGTIAGMSAPGADERDYRAAQRSIGELLATVPGLTAADLLDSEQVAQVDSKDMGPAVWLRLVARLRHHLARPDVRAVVVTHGTDTLEETAYLLQRVLAPVKPVVMTAAMRPANATWPDGPANLRDAFRVATDPRATGVVAVVGGWVFAAHDLRKVHPTRLDAFAAGEAGPLARLEGSEVQWLRDAPRDTAWSGVLPDDPANWPRVEIVASHAGTDGAIVAAVCGLGARGIVVVATGNGTLHDALQRELAKAGAAGVQILCVSRCTEGAVDPRPDAPFALAADLTAPKARIALQLQLMADEPG